MHIDHVKLWKRKKYIDLWTVPHILTGTILASFFYWLQFDFLLNILISTILLISWEFIEYFIILDVKEKLSNSISDILAGWLGFSIMYFFILKFSFDLIYPLESYQIAHHTKAAYMGLIFPLNLQAKTLSFHQLQLLVELK